MIDPVSQTILKRIEEKAKTGQEKQDIAYRRQCPRCMRWQVKETMLKQGCFACDWKPAKREEK